ncbi:MAG: hypothetical protein ACFFF4_15885 [Candidatus Thorarchaeota archaeon]
MDKVLKNHITYGIGFFILGFFTVFVCVLVVVTLIGAFEALLGGNLFYFGGVGVMSGVYGFVAAALALWLRQEVKDYLNRRLPKIPEGCLECKKKLHLYDVKWIEEYNRAECPHCGVELKVTKEWTADSF